MFNLALMCSMLSMLSRFLVMRGHRLRIARVGEIRRCWASSLVLDKDKEVLFRSTHRRMEDLSRKMQQLMKMLCGRHRQNSYRVMVIPYLVSDIWGQLLSFGATVKNTQPYVTSTPESFSTASLVRIATEVGFSKEDMIATSEVVDSPMAVSKGAGVLYSGGHGSAYCTSKAASQDHEGWAQGCRGVACHGPLPPNTISPQLTLGDCPVRMISCAHSGERRRRPEAQAGCSSKKFKL